MGDPRMEIVKNNVQQNMDSLKSKISLKHTSLWDVCISNSVISLDDKSEIQDVYPAERNQVEQLLVRILKGTFKKFETFCDCLRKVGQGHIVTDYLQKGLQGQGDAAGAES